MAQSAHELAACSMFAQTAALTEVEAEVNGCSLLPEPATRDNLTSSKPGFASAAHQLSQASRGTLCAFLLIAPTGKAPSGEHIDRLRVSPHAVRASRL